MCVPGIKEWDRRRDWLLRFVGALIGLVCLTHRLIENDFDTLIVFAVSPQLPAPHAPIAIFPHPLHHAPQATLTLPPQLPAPPAAIAMLPHPFHAFQLHPPPLEEQHAPPVNARGPKQKTRPKSSSSPPPPPPNDPSPYSSLASMKEKASKNKHQALKLPLRIASTKRKRANDLSSRAPFHERPARNSGRAFKAGERTTKTKRTRSASSVSARVPKSSSMKGPAPITDQVCLWNQNLNDLAAWIEHHDGKCPRQVSIDAEESKLGRWLDRQRSQHRESVLSSDRVAEFEKLLGPIWNAYTTGFHEHVGTLKKWMSDYDKAPSQGASTPLESSAAFVKHQRTAYAQDLLPKDRIATLESVEGWTWSEQALEQERTRNTVLRWLQEHESDPARDSADVQEAALANWMHNQRKLYVASSLHPERQVALEQLPRWCWSFHDARWAKMYAAAGRLTATDGATSDCETNLGYTSQDADHGLASSSDSDDDEGAATGPVRCQIMQWFAHQKA